MKPSLRLAALVAFCVAPLGATTAPTTAPTAPRAHSGDGWAIAAPADWRAFAPLPAGKVLHLIGDAKPGMPPVDGTLSAVQVGLSVERFAAGRAPLADRVRRDLAELTAGRFVPLGEPKVDAIALADGTAASRLTARLLRRDNGRASFYAKVYAAAPDGAQLVATSFVTCGRPGVRSIEAIGLPEFAAAHAATLVLNPAKLDVAALDAAYRRYAWDGARALAFTSRVNEAIDQKQYGSAIAGFRMLLKKWDAIPAAHNGLAWALLQKEPSTPEDAADSAAHAVRAVEWTESLDADALDTLALAYERTGDRAKAVAAIEQAVALRPGDATLQKRLEALRAKQ